MKRLERVGHIVTVGVFWGIILGLAIDISKQEMGQPLIYHAEIAQAEEAEPEVVLIEEKIEWSKDRIEQEIRATFPENPDLAVAIAKVESGLNKDAYNPERHKGCSGSIGIMQIACVHHRENPDALFDVPFNLQKAREIYEGDGNTFEAWGAYKNGSYKQYMK